MSGLSGGVLPGDEIYLLGEVGLSGTRLLAGRYREKLLALYPPSFVERMEELGRKAGEEREQGEAYLFLENRGLLRDDSPLHGHMALGEGGLLYGLWDFLEESGLGFCGADLREVPVRQETIEACEACGENPYTLESRGAFLLALSNGRELQREAEGLGIPCAYLGRVTREAERTMGNHERRMFLYPGGE